MFIMVINITDDKRLTSQQCSYMPLLLRLSAERISKHQLQAVHILAHDTRTSSKDRYRYRYRYIFRYANMQHMPLALLAIMTTKAFDMSLSAAFVSDQHVSDHSCHTSQGVALTAHRLLHWPIISQKPKRKQPRCPTWLRERVNVDLLCSKSAPQLLLAAISHLHFNDWRLRLTRPDHLKLVISGLTCKQCISLTSLLVVP